MSRAGKAAVKMVSLALALQRLAILDQKTFNLPWQPRIECKLKICQAVGLAALVLLLLGDRKLQQEIAEQLYPSVTVAGSCNKPWLGFE